MSQYFTPVVRLVFFVCVGVFVLQKLIQVLPLLPASLPVERLAMNGHRVWFGQEYYRLVTHLFLHGNWAHLLVNMLALVSFGHTVEQTYGSARFALLYLLGGVTAGLLFGLTTPGALCIGASGAVAAVLMVSALKFPQQLVIVGFLPMPVRWFALMYVIVEGYGALGNPLARDGIAHFAHLGGLGFGYAWFRLFDGRVRRQLPR